MNIKIAKLIAQINPKIIFDLNKEQIDDEIIDIAIKKRLSPKKDKNGVLITNVSYIIKMCNSGMIDSILPFIKVSSFAPEEIDTLLEKITSNNILALIRNDKNFLKFLKQSDKTDTDFFKSSLLYSLSDDELETVPDFLKQNNTIFLNRYVKTGSFLTNINKMLELNPEYRKIIIDNAYDRIIANNEFQYISGFQEDFINIAINKMNDETKSKLLDYLKSTKADLTSFISLFNNNIDFISLYLLQNPSQVDCTSIGQIIGSKEISNIISNYIKTQKENVDLYVLTYSYSLLSDELKEEVLSLMYDLLLSKKTNSNILSFEPFTQKYFDKVLKEGPELIIGSLRKKSDGSEDKNPFIKFLPFEYKKKIYEYILRNNDIKEFDTNNFKAILEDNFDINLIPDSGEIVYKFSVESKEKIIAILKAIKESNKNITIVLQTKEENVPLLKELKDIIPGKIFVKFETGFKEEYNIEELISKDQTLQYYADSILNQKDKEGNIKVLSPYEKYIAAYKIVTHFSHYIDSNILASSRALYQIINAEDQKIVCVGYSNLLVELLKRVGLTECMEWSVFAAEEAEKRETAVNNTKISNHSRVLVHIKDEKYGIDNIFMADPTWDAIKKPQKTSDGLSQDMSETYRYAHIALESLANPQDGSNFYVDKLAPSSESFSEILQTLDPNEVQYVSVGEKAEEYAKKKITPAIKDEKLIQALVVIDNFVDKNQSPRTLSPEYIERDDFNRKACQMGKIDILIDIDKDVSEAEAKPYELLINEDYGSYESLIRYKLENKMAQEINNTLTNDIFQINVSNGKVEISFRKDIFRTGKYSDDELENIFMQLKQEMATSGFQFKEGYDYNLIFEGSIIDISKPLSASYDKIASIAEAIDNLTNKIVQERHANSK